MEEAEPLGPEGGSIMSLFPRLAHPEIKTQQESTKQLPELSPTGFKIGIHRPDERDITLIPEGWCC